MHRYYQRTMTVLLNRLANCENPWIKNGFIWIVLKLYPAINLAEAQQVDRRNYRSFNDFFTRRLRPGARLMRVDPNYLLAPADGELVSLGPIKRGQLQQVKGRWYSLQALLADHAEWACLFDGGYSATLYLRPDCYHRVHMPYAGRLISMAYVPGDLFSVGPSNTRKRLGLFARNERVVALFETDRGYLAMVMVGALLVSGIETVWQGLVNVNKHAKTCMWDYTDKDIILQQGDEMGCFHYGSTVVVLTASSFGSLEALVGASDFVHMGTDMLQTSRA